MWLSLFSTELDDDALVDRIKKDSDFTTTVLSVAEKITFDIVHSMFLEDPTEYLACVIVVDFPDVEEVVFTATLDDAFYNKHIGKFIREVQRRLINDIIIKFVTEIEEIDWETL